jgi:hypothetical protein
MKSLLRVWQELDLKDVEQSLIVVGELSAECFACHKVGINSTSVQCPQCGAHFKYMGFRRRVDMNYLRKLREDFPYMVLIDFDDFKKATGKSTARKLLDL